ncbi:hypothetical protein COU14_00395 [Candidatus Kaiserbacteria bacterium CG10_big_fil_rev_8_21_14_0_10_44_10]|uniref:Uncharacterized protein n=1 Tax=Candidatus Kaiserbacteria bacterium CG10_big_fil_rev_8_21_14_0_10_44_10 TaxID=1974606 RepID=A0A2H0UIB8_9BACT|nr:MAG: hypothetical protein COU14_00395 [Candidatus Kaiserbacteria bacterium CG10_big_fil_rev_8_21_14_0_10_44_10]
MYRAGANQRGRQMKKKYGFDDESKHCATKRPVNMTLVALTAGACLFIAIIALAVATNRFPTFNHLLFTYSKI